MKVKVEEEGEVDLEEESTVEDLLKELDYHLDSVVVISDDDPLPLDYNLEKDMEVKIIPVVSGG